MPSPVAENPAPAVKPVAEAPVTPAPENVQPWPEPTPAAPEVSAAPVATAAPAPAPIVVERVVTHEVTRWPWWLALVLALLGFAWWRSHGRAERLNENSTVLERRQRTLQSAHQQLRERAEQLQQTAVHDGLTGTLTRQAFASEFEAALAHAAHFGRPVALLMFDLDHFKQINDGHGHAAGDAALKLVAGIVREKLTSSDLFGRFGGDEFLIGCAGSDGDAAMRLAGEIRESLARNVLEGRAASLELSLSLGVAIANPETGYEVDALFHRADAALYAAKRGGRDRAVLAERVMPNIDAGHTPRTLARPA
jgi:diguanylate cyclase (GGDEF)-like protein